jgi:hypothetical protein
MSDLVVRASAAYWPSLSTACKVVCLFSLLGLALTAAMLPMIAPEELTWVLSRIE